MNEKTRQNMEEINRRMVAAIEKSVAKGQSRGEAFAAHMKYLAEAYPAVFAAYCQWLNPNMAETYLAAVNSL